MRKLLMMTALCLLTAEQMAAQETTIRDSKMCDSWYIGVNGGSSVKTTGIIEFYKMNPFGSLRIGRYLTPVFGLTAEGTAYFSDKQFVDSRTFVKSVNASLLANVNLSNWLGGYLDKPRRVELVAVAGMGWGHVFGTGNVKYNDLTSKLGLDLAVNVGRARAWQFYLEPSIVYNLNRQPDGVAYNLQQSGVGVALGINYKLPNSNGTHNFVRVGILDQYEVDMLNQQLNELRYEQQQQEKALARNGRTIRELRDSLEEARQVKPATIIKKVTQVVNNNVLQPTVIFGQGKSAVDAAQMASVAMIAKYMKNHPTSRILIKGYASPEGNPELNQRLSEARANAVKQALVSRYGISADRLTTQGMGATDELFDEIDFNRVATFTDLTK
jgi:outer membrane protein OmpA-like peptidoglycan-associated protein